MKWGKIISKTEVQDAPVVYEGIINFNSSERLMRERGFVPYGVAYEKATGQKCFFEVGTEVSDEEYTDIPCPDSGRYVWDEQEGNWIMHLELAKEQKKCEIRKMADTTAAMYEVEYTEVEKATWVRQEKGMKDILSGNMETDEAKWVQALAETRGIGLDEMVGKISRAVGLANLLSAKIVGTQQSLEDRVNACTTTQEVEAISWEFNAE